MLIRWGVVRHRPGGDRVRTERTGLFRGPKVRSSAVEAARLKRWITAVVAVSVAVMVVVVVVVVVHCGCSSWLA